MTPSAPTSGKPTTQPRVGQASIRDVAATAGVSVGTVSNVLNRPTAVRPTTRAKVEAVIASLGFVRNESARQLRSGTSRIVPYVMLDSANPFFTDVARGAEDLLTAAGLSLFLGTSDDDPMREARYLDLLQEQRVCGVLITPIDPQEPRLTALPLRGTPVVIVDRVAPDPNICSVAVDDVLGGDLAATHLLEMGHERIAFVGGHAKVGQVHDRLAGARRAIERAGLPADVLTEIDTAALSIAEGRSGAQRLAGLPAGRRPTAALCANDLLALGLLQQCMGMGVRVPDDLAIVGYDDIEFAGAAAVPLTSVRQPRAQLGQAAMDLLFEEATDPDTHQHRQVVFEPELIVRDSTVRVG